MAMRQVQRKEDYYLPNWGHLAEVYSGLIKKYFNKLYSYFYIHLSPLIYY